MASAIRRAPRPEQEQLTPTRAGGISSLMIQQSGLTLIKTGSAIGLMNDGDGLSDQDEVGLYLSDPLF